MYVGNHDFAMLTYMGLCFDENENVNDKNCRTPLDLSHTFSHLGEWEQKSNTPYCGPGHETMHLQGKISRLAT
jgi:hypothetical protein